jgi:hypothetical protein
MASAVEISNRALSKLGEQRITSLDDNTKPARAMKARFDLLRDAELASYAWRFAVTRTTLAASSAVPAWGYARIFPRPVDDLRPLRVNNAYVDFRTVGVQIESTGFSRYDQAYQIIGGQIETNLPAPLEYEYIRKVTNTGEWDALFAEAFACRLAVDAAEELTQSNTKVEVVARQYEEAIRQARRVNALYAPPRRKPMGSFMQARAY